MAYLYVLECRDGMLYTGSTIDLERRLAAHQIGEGAEYTRHRLPVKLLWCAQFDRIEDAFRWEKRMQGWSHTKKLRFIAGGVEAIRGYSAEDRRRRLSSPSDTGA